MSNSALNWLTCLITVAIGLKLFGNPIKNLIAIRGNLKEAKKNKEELDKLLGDYNAQR